MRHFLYLLCFAILWIASCDQPNGQSCLDITAEGWSITDTLVYASVGVSQPQDVFVRVTFDENYTYSNLFLKVWLGADTDTLQPVQSEYVLMDLAGNWYEAPGEVNHTFELPIASGNIETGTRFRVIHAMRDDQLSGVTKVCMVQRDRPKE